MLFIIHYHYNFFAWGKEKLFASFINTFIFKRLNMVFKVWIKLNLFTYPKRGLWFRWGEEQILDRWCTCTNTEAKFSAISHRDLPMQSSDRFDWNGTFLNKVYDWQKHIFKYSLWLTKTQTIEKKKPMQTNIKVISKTKVSTGGHLIEFHLIESVDRIFRSNA